MMARAIRSLSLRTQLTIWYSLVLFAVAAVFAAVVVWQQGRIGLRRVDRELDALTATLENVLQDELTEMPNPAAAAAEAHKTLAAPGHAIVVAVPAGVPPAGVAVMVMPLAALEALGTMSTVTVPEMSA